MNVLLVDDDYFVVKALESKIDWRAMNVEHVHTAYNVAQAREILLEYTVQILICDIEMPQGSGLELLAWVRQENYPVQAIFLTNYADFNYAQKAIELQSFDYFLKPIEVDKLTLIIRKAIAKAREQKHNELAIHEGELWQKSRKSVLEDFWTRLIAGKAFPSSPSAAAGAITEENLPYRLSDLFLPVLVTLFPQEASLGREDKPLFDYALLNVMYELFQHPSLSVEAISEFKEGNWMLILKWTLAPDRDIPRRLCDSLIAESRKFLKCDCSCHIATSRPLGEIRKAVKELLHVNEEWIKHRNETIFVDGSSGLEPAYVPPNLGLLERLLGEGAYGSFLDETEAYLTRLMRENALCASVLRPFRHDMVQIVYAHLKSREIQAHQLYAGSEGDRLHAQSLHSVEDMQGYLRYLVRTAAHSRPFAEPPKSIADEVASHIHAHLAHDLTRTSLAETVFLNPDYMARLFKKETGMPLGTYIIQARLSEAKRLLQDTSLSVRAVADQVGYANDSHFSKLFKQETGCSPADYRKAFKKLARPS
ncbi:helix-turn-helix domain-containing protein [Paenibacillus sp. D51F]